MTLRPIAAIAADLHLDPDHVHAWGPHRAQVSLDALSAAPRTQVQPRLVLVSALNPTPAGEGKTVTTIGLGQGLRHIGKDVC